MIQKRHEAEQLFDTLSKMSGEEIAKVYDTGHVLRKEQVSPVQNDCLPSINLCGMSIGPPLTAAVDIPFLWFRYQERS